MLNRRTVIQSIIAAPIVGLPKEKKPELFVELFVVETPDGRVCKDGEPINNYCNDSGGQTYKSLPLGRWKLARIVFEKVGD